MVFSGCKNLIRWDRVTGQYFVTRNDASLIAFNVPSDQDVVQGMKMTATHTDSPCLKIKPNPVVCRKGYYELGVEVYGSVLLSSWFDRDLSIAGRVSFVDGQGKIQSALIEFQRPVAVIPNLAIHLDRKVNEQRGINAQTDIMPILMQVKDDSPTEFNTLLIDRFRIEHEGLQIQRILDYELSLYDTQPPVISGFNEEFLSSARLDNLLSCFVGLRSLIDIAGQLPLFVGLP